MANLSDLPILDDDNHYEDDGDLFNYEAGLDEALKDLTNIPDHEQSVSNEASTDHSAAALGLEKEVKIQKKRAPIAKLDDARLLSQNGIPRLRRKAKTKLKFRGKGHEFSDAAQLLRFYQLWLDDLYPRAKFTDGLAIIQKLGHSKRMQVMRKTWLDEGKVVKINCDTNGFGEEIAHRNEDNSTVSQAAEVVNRPNAQSDMLNSKTSNITADQGQQFHADDNELFSSLPQHQHDQNAEVPDDDELDALLAERDDEDKNNHRSASDRINAEELSPSSDSLDVPHYLEDTAEKEVGLLVSPS